MATTQVLKQRYPQIKVITLTSFQESHYVGEVLQAGAISYLLKSVLPEELADAIRAAHLGWATLAREAAQTLVQTCGDGL